MASTVLSRSVSSTGEIKKATLSVWLKKTKATGEQFMFYSYENNNNNFRFRFNPEFIEAKTLQGGSTVMQIATNRLFKDPSAWYHIVLALDSTQSTSSDRCKIYINGVQETSLATSTYPSADANLSVNENGSTVYIGAQVNSNYFDGSMSHLHYIDGTAYAASTFGSTDATTGIWKINTSPSVTYGTNGFFILKDGNGVTDQSGNGNNLTTSGTLTNTEDNPSNSFATMNPLDNYYPGSAFSNGNNTVVTTSGNYSYNTATIGVNSGKYYWEVKAGSGNAVYMLIGLASQLSTSTSNFLGNSNYQYAYYGNGGQYYNNNSQTGYGNAYAANDIIGVAMDLDNNKLYFSKNGTWQNSGDPTSGSTGTGAISIADPSSTVLGNYFPAVSEYDNSNSYTFDVNFGNGYFGTTAISSEGTNASNIGKFEYDVPTGYTALCTKGLNE